MFTVVGEKKTVEVVEIDDPQEQPQVADTANL